MSFINKTYIEGVTPITADNMNDINNFLGRAPAPGTLWCNRLTAM